MERGVLPASLLATTTTVTIPAGRYPVQVKTSVAEPVCFFLIGSGSKKKSRLSIFVPIFQQHPTLLTKKIHLSLRICFSI